MTTTAIERTPPRSLSTPANLHILRGLVRYLGARRTLEVGLAYGGSALALLDAMDGSHTAIDPWQASVWHNEAVLAIEAAGHADRFTLIQKGSEIALPELVAENRHFDLIYIDGSHLFEHVIRDALYSVDLLRLGGVVVFDDCAKPAIRKVLRFLSKNYFGIVRELDLGPFRPQRSVARRVAQKLGLVQARALQRVRQAGREWNEPFYNF